MANRQGSSGWNLFTQIQRKLGFKTYLERDLSPSNSNMFVCVESYTGELSISGWTNNDENNRFWNSVPLPNLPIELGARYDHAYAWIDACMGDPTRANGRHESLGGYLWVNRGAPIDQAYKDDVEQKFNALLTMLRSPLNLETSHKVIISPFLRAGENSIHYHVVPTKAPWSITFSLFIKTGNKKTVIQRTFLDTAAPRANAFYFRNVTD